MSKIQIFIVVLILGLLTFPLTGSAFAKEVLPANEIFEKKDDNATDKQKSKIKAASEEEEAIKKARMEWKKAEREKQEAINKEKQTKKEKQEAINKTKKKKQNAKKKASKKNGPDEFWIQREMDLGRIK